MAKELELLEEFEKDGHTRRQILFENRSLLADYTKKRCILHIKTNAYTSKELLEALDNSSFAVRSKLSEDVLKLNQYGLKHKKYTCQCKECGGKFEYHLPLLFGLPL